MHAFPRQAGGILILGQHLFVLLTWYAKWTVVCVMQVVWGRLYGIFEEQCLTLKGKNIIQFTAKREKHHTVSS